VKVRQNLYIDRALSDALEALSSKPGANKSRIVNDALGAYVARSATREVDDLLKIRLDRISREIGQVRRDVEIVLETLALFIHYQLTVTAPLPEADPAALAVGNDRFERFISQLGRQIAAGKHRLRAANDPEARS
jgi:predicted transcriptional regulator